MARLSGLKKQLLKRRRMLIGTAALAILLSVVRVEQGKLTWAEWTGIGADVEETRTQEMKPDAAGTKITISKKFQSGKTLWDWLSLLGVPLSLAALGFWLQQLQQKQAAESHRLQQEQASEEAKEEILQSYFDRISTLLIDKNVIAIAAKVSSPVPANITDEEKELVNASVDVIRARTFSMLRRLGADRERKGDVIRFLAETDIVSKLKLNLSKASLSMVNLSGTKLGFADLSGANLSGANLSGANLSFADLKRADLSLAHLSSTKFFGANLSGALIFGTDLSFAYLACANLERANLHTTDLSGVNLNRAKLDDADLSYANLSSSENWTEEQLTQAKLCKTKLPPGTSLNPDRDCEELGIPTN
jgi:uncharacterized protein YjbI with pentapeptide repeats